MVLVMFAPKVRRQFEPYLGIVWPYVLCLYIADASTQDDRSKLLIVIVMALLITDLYLTMHRQLKLATYSVWRCTTNWLLFHFMHIPALFLGWLALGAERI